MKIRLVLLSVLFVASAWAGWDPEAGVYDTTGYIQMKQTESGNTSSYATGTNWNPPAPTAPGNKYFVQEGKQLRLLTAADNDAREPFKGDVLAVRGTLSGPCTKVNIPNLDLLAGCIVCLYSTPIAYENATIGIYPDRKKPAAYVKIDHGVAGSNNKVRETNGWVLNNVKLFGPEDAHLYFDNARSNSVGYVHFSGTCDVSEYFGKITAASHKEFLDDGYGGHSYGGVKFGPDVTGFPGTIVLGTNSVLDVTNVTEAAIASSKIEINNLTVQSGTEFRVANGASDTRTISVTNSFVHDEGPVRLVLDRFPADYRTAGFTPNANLVPFRVKVAAGDTGDEPSFSVSDFVLPEYADTFELPKFNWSVKRADGWDSLVCEGRKVVVKTSSHDAQDVSSLIDATAWSDGQVPHFGADYYLATGIRLTSGMAGFWGEGNCYKSTNPDHVSNTYVWQGDSVTLGNCNMQFNGVNGLFVTNMAIAAGSYLTMYGPKFHLYTVNPVRILPVAGQYAMLYVYNGSEVHVENGIEGSGDVWCEFRGKNFPNGKVELLGANTNFTGKVLLACKGFMTSGSEDYTPSETNRVEVIVNDARNLGGAREEYTWNALRIRDWSLLDITNTTDFAETTRGVFVDNVACLRVAADETATFRAPFVFGGELRKDGAGTLALGATEVPRYAYNTSVTDDTYAFFDGPVAGTNALYVKEGALRPLTTKAVDGLAIRFANGTRLELDQSVKAIRENGLFNTAWATPVAFDGDDAKVTVAAVNVPPGTEDMTLTVATLPEGQAEGVVAHLTPAPRSGFRPKLTVNDPVEGKETITLSYVKTGALIFFR